MENPKRIGVVLSSGGGRGVFAHTGFLLALKTMGIEVSAIAGCSAGALVGGIFASGTDLIDWKKALSEVRAHEYWKPDPWSGFFWNMVVRKGRGYSGFSETGAAIEFIRRNLTAKHFEECPIPFFCLAMNLTQGAKTLFSQGELAPRIMASAAMPLLYRPVEIDGKWYSDGALIDLAPSEAICCNKSLKIDALIIHHTAVHREASDGHAWVESQPWSFMEILHLLLYRHRPWYLSNKPISFHNCPGDCGVPVIVLEPNLPELSWPLNRGGAEIEAAAMEQAITQLQPHLSTFIQPQNQISHSLAE